MPDDKDFELEDLDSFSFEELSLDDIDEEHKKEATDQQYGVWVKEEAGETAVQTPSSEISDLPGLPELSDLPDFPEELTTQKDPAVQDMEEDALSMEELAKLDDQFEMVPVEASPVSSEDDLETTLPVDSTVNFDEVSLDDFVTPDEEDNAGAPDAPQASNSNPQEEVPVDDDFLDIDIDIEDDIGDEELEILESSQGIKEKEELGVDGTEEVDLSEFGDFTDDLAIDSPSVQPEANQEEPVLQEMEPFPEMSDLAPELTVGEDSFDEAILDETTDEVDMNQILALEEDLTSGVKNQAPQEPNNDVMAQILSKVEAELTSLKQEITDLKKEVNSLKPSEIVPPTAQESSSRKKSSGGFFEEEDDEKIALTGDELDNILSTAEVSEGVETGETVEEDLTHDAPVAEDLIVTDETGNILETSPDMDEPLITEQTIHTTDEDFLSNTELDDALKIDAPELPETTVEEKAQDFGIPDGIELEEAILSPTDEETENLLNVEETPVPVDSKDTNFEFEPPVIDIPFDDEIGMAHLSETPAPESEEESIIIEPEDAFSEPEIMSEPEPEPEPVPAAPQAPAAAPAAAEAPAAGLSEISPSLKEELKSVLTYMDRLLSSLPDDKIQEFAESEHFEVYKKLFEELGLIE